LRVQWYTAAGQGGAFRRFEGNMKISQASVPTTRVAFESTCCAGLANCYSDLFTPDFLGRRLSGTCYSTFSGMRYINPSVLPSRTLSLFGDPGFLPPLTVLEEIRYSILTYSNLFKCCCHQASNLSDSLINSFSNPSLVS